MFGFIKAYIKSMRLYYSFVTGIAGWIGVAYYEFIAHFPPERTIEVAPTPAKKIVILILLFLSWGINQIINDFLGLREDRINAPDRPMVTGELNPKWALIVSGILLLFSGLITWFYLEPYAVVFLVLGVLLNVIYEYAKGYGILGNIVFGLMITMATLYGAFAAGPTASTFLYAHRLSALILVFCLNAVMTFYTYFKDYRGDKAAGKNTVIVAWGLGKSRIMALVSAFIPVAAFGILRWTDFLSIPMNNVFMTLGFFTVILLLKTGFLYFRYPSGERTYDSLKTNFRACVCGQATIIALFNQHLAIVLFIVSFFSVGLLFTLHRNRKA
ncbi:MAG: UbiA family prenyltransferase [Spirochaetales bacterium]|nr:UbiA family prenyltransferase [Spirochaetales bacterium]